MPLQNGQAGAFDSSALIPFAPRPKSQTHKPKDKLTASNRIHYHPKFHPKNFEFEIIVNHLWPVSSRE
jgi:hypothetical protein